MYKQLAVFLFISNLPIISFASHQSNKKRSYQNNEQKTRIEKLSPSAKFTDIPDTSMYQILAYATDITGTPRGNSVVQYKNDNDEEKETWFVNPEDLKPTIKYLYSLRRTNKQLKSCIDSNQFSQDIIASLSHRFDRSDFPCDSRHKHSDKLSIATSIKTPAGYRYLDEYITTSGQYDLFKTAWCIQSILNEITGSIESVHQETTDQGLVYYVCERQHTLITPWFSTIIKIPHLNNSAALTDLLISQQLFQHCTVKPFDVQEDKEYVQQNAQIPLNQEEPQPLANYFQPIAAADIENLPAGSDIICRANSLGNTWDLSQNAYSIETFDGQQLPKAIRPPDGSTKEKVKKSLYTFMGLKAYSNGSNEPIDLSNTTPTPEEKSLFKYFNIATMNESAPQDVIPTRSDSPLIDTTPVYWQETPLLAVREFNGQYMEYLHSEEEWILFTANLANKPHIQGELENRINTFGLRKKALCSDRWTNEDKASFYHSSWSSSDYAEKSYLWIKKDSVDKIAQKLGLNLVQQEKHRSFQPSRGALADTAPRQKSF